MPSLFKPYGFRMISCIPYGTSHEFALSNLIAILKADSSNRFPVDILCPACGHTLPGCAKSQGDYEIVSLRMKIKKHIKSIWPKIAVERWVLAVYVRDSSEVKSSGL